MTPPYGRLEVEAENQEALITAGMLADRLRPIVLGGERSCLDGTSMVPLHLATVTSIYLHLERLAKDDGERTLGALEWDIAASAIEAGTTETAQTGSVHESAVPQADAQSEVRP